MYTFQFHIGTIKRPGWLIDYVICKKFQFHIGTIKREIIENIKMVTTVFQFHIGTIKRLNQHQKHDSYFYFNSILVRLKAGAEVKMKEEKLISIPYWYD